MEEQLKIEIPIERNVNDNYVEAKIQYEKDKTRIDLAPVFFCYLPSTKKYSCTTLSSKSLIESFNFIIIE